MKKHFSKTAFTLIELILSSLLVTLILLGIFTISNVLTNSNQDYGQRYLVKSETQATLNHILNNITFASGSANTADEGILIGTAGLGNVTDPVNNPNTFCIHQQGGAGNNLINNAADIWLCYTWSGNQINWCAETYTAGADPRGATSCNHVAGTANIIPASSQPIYLGTAKTMTVPPIIAGQILFNITISNCLNDAIASCAAQNDPANNPYVTVNGSASPTQESM